VWPGGASGATIGIGYDRGYSTANTIQGDRGDKLPAPMCLQDVAGIHGSPASSYAHSLRGVLWDAAMAVFIGHLCHLLIRIALATSRLSAWSVSLLIYSAPTPARRGQYKFKSFDQAIVQSELKSSEQERLCCH
jgi:hypothetical protein